MVKTYVAVLPDGTEYFSEGPLNKPGICQAAIRKAGLTTPRSNPVKVEIQLYSVKIVDGELKRSSIGTYELRPPLERMTKNEYLTAMREILEGIPYAFHMFLEGQSYDRGHSAGYEESVEIAREIADELKPCIEEYRKGLS